MLLRRQWLERFKDEGSLAQLRGGHGYDNREPDMMGLFIAYGPSFHAGDPAWIPRLLRATP